MVGGVRNIFQQGVRVLAESKQTDKALPIFGQVLGMGMGMDEASWGVRQPVSSSHSVHQTRVVGSRRTSFLGGSLLASRGTDTVPLSQLKDVRRSFFSFAEPSPESKERIDRMREQVTLRDDDERFPGTKTLKDNQGALASVATKLETRQDEFLARSLLDQMSPFSPDSFAEPAPRDNRFESSLAISMQEDHQALFKNRPYIQASKEALGGFESEIVEIRKNAKGDEKVFARELYDYYLDTHDMLNKVMLSTLLTEFWNLGEYDYCVELVDNSSRQDFKSDPDTMVRYTRALLKSNYFNMERAINMTQLLIERGNDGPEVQAILGVIHAIKMNATAKLMEVDGLDIPQKDKKNLKLKRLDDFRKCFPEIKELDLSPENLQGIWSVTNAQSKTHYMKAWSADLDPRYGVRVLHRLLEAGKMDEAKTFADHIQLACIRDGVDNPSQRNQALTRAMLEVVLLRDTPSIDKIGLDIRTLQYQLLSSCDTPAKTQHSIISLENFGRIFPDNVNVKSTISILKKHKARLEHSGNYGKVMAQMKARIPMAHLKSTVDFEDFSTTYRPYFGYNFWSGNTHFGGQLTAHCVHQRDIAFFTKMLSIPLIELPIESDGLINPYQTLGDIDDPKELSKIADLLIRFAFKTGQGKEKLNSAEHKIFDEKVIALFWYLGAVTPDLRKNLPDTYTNVAYSLATGLGDCRHQAQVKQLMFDMWQKGKINNWIKGIEAIDAMEKGDITDALKARREDYVNLIKENLKTQMRVIHTEVHAPVEMKDKLPVWKGDHLVLGENAQTVEEHTLNVLVHYDDKGNIEDVELADSFYWETYDFRSGRVDIDGFSSGERVQVDKIKVFDPDNEELVEVPVYMKPTPWSIGIDSSYKPGTTPAFMGMPIPNSDTFFDPKNLNTSLSQSDAALRKIRAAFLREHPPKEE
jgi:hypothetical protein